MFPLLSQKKMKSLKMHSYIWYTDIYTKLIAKVSVKIFYLIFTKENLARGNDTKTSRFIIFWNISNFLELLEFFEFFRNFCVILFNIFLKNVWIFLEFYNFFRNFSEFLDLTEFLNLRTVWSFQNFKCIKIFGISRILDYWNF